MAMLGKIRRTYSREGLSLSEISRRTTLSRNTLKKWLKTPEGAEPKYRRQSGETNTCTVCCLFAEGIGDGLAPSQARPTDGEDVV